MPGRSPSPVLVVDANIVLSAALGFRTLPVIHSAGRMRKLVISAAAATEALMVGHRLAADASWASHDVTSILEQLDVVDVERYDGLVDPAATRLRNGPASRNGSSRDAHVLALAWTYDADIWSHDRDFAGTGWPSWSSANLAAALADEASHAAGKSS